MSKSTPISQLPSSDNGSMQGDVIEDDATVQEVLNQISQSTGVSDIPQMASPVQYQPLAPAPAAVPVSMPASTMLQQQQQQFQQHQHQYLAQQMAQAQQLPGTAQQLLSPKQQQPPAAQPFYFQMPPYQPPDALSSSNEQGSGAAASITNEIRLILLVVIVSVVIQIIPIDAFIQRVHVLGKIPYGHIFVKAALAGVLFFAIRKYVS